MKLSILPEVFAKLRELRLGVLVGRGVRNDGEAAEMPGLLREEEGRIRGELRAEGIAGHPRILCWREAYRAFGAKPKEHRSSVENLYRLVLKGGEVRAINPLVDIYNFVSLRLMLPAGGEDMDTVSGDIELAVAGPAEPAVRLLGEAEERPPHPGEIIYRDTISAICRRLNWKEAERTKLTRETRNAVLVLEALPPITAEDLGGALGELKRLISLHCGGNLSDALLDASSPTLEA
jgi:DNA/RNA-binding domain of Phe-tRNA-synthetase-like protein